MEGLLSGYLFGPLASPVLLAQTSGDPVSTFAPLGVAGAICVVLTWVWLRAEARAERAEERERAQAQRYEERLERFLPIAAQTADVLKETTSAARTIASPTPADPRFERLLEDLTGALDDLKRGRR